MKEPQREPANRQRGTKAKRTESSELEKARAAQGEEPIRPTLDGTVGTSPPASPAYKEADPVVKRSQSGPIKTPAQKPAKKVFTQRENRSSGSSADESRTGDFHERVARRAYELYEASGYAGDATQHWLEAEREVRAQKEGEDGQNRPTQDRDR